MEQRLIDANALYENLERRYKGANGGLLRLAYKAAIDDICNAPTIDPVKHGRWIDNTDDFTPKKRCSHCGYNKPVAAGDRLTQEPENYCPNCGACMKEEHNVSK